MIPRIDAATLAANDAEALAALREAATGVGFATVFNTALTRTRVIEVIEVYRAFFKQPEAAKQALNMARTGSNRGWGRRGPNRSIRTPILITNSFLTSDMSCRAATR